LSTFFHFLIKSEERRYKILDDVSGSYKNGSRGRLMLTCERERSDAIVFEVAEMR
jgi:hypothetical protein